MKPDPKKLIDEAMQLEPASRALVAEAILESLDLEPDVEVSAEWREEIRRRCAAIDRGTVELIQGEQVIADLRAKYD